MINFNEWVDVVLAACHATAKQQKADIVPPLHLDGGDISIDVRVYSEPVTLSGEADLRVPLNELIAPLGESMQIAVSDAISGLIDRLSSECPNILFTFQRLALKVQADTGTVISLSIHYD